MQSVAKVDNICNIFWNFCSTWLEEKYGYLIKEEQWIHFNAKGLWLVVDSPEFLLLLLNKVDFADILEKCVNNIKNFKQKYKKLCTCICEVSHVWSWGYCSIPVRRMECIEQYKVALTNMADLVFIGSYSSWGLENYDSGLWSNKIEIMNNGTEINSFKKKNKLGLSCAKLRSSFASQPVHLS